MTTSDVSALLVDDEVSSDFIQGVVKLAAELGLHIRPVEEGAAVSAISEYGPDVLILDAKIRTSPRQLARLAVKQKPGLAVFFWTAFAADEDFDELSTSLNPLVDCGVGIKVPRADTSSEILGDSLVLPVLALAEKSERRHIRPLPGGPAARAEVFHTAVDEFNEMTIASARRLVAEGQEEAADIVHHIFDNSEAEWLLLAGPGMDVIRWGATLANMPDSRRIYTLGQRFGYIPLLFTRPVEVDQIDFQGVRKWSECPPGDYYPCLGIDFKGDPTSTQQIHLDTGAVKTLLSLERLEEAGVVGEYSPIDIRPGEHRATMFQFIDREVQILLSDGGEAAALELRVYVIFDWTKSPFSRICHHGSCPGSQRIGSSGTWSCGRREVGLLGRDVLIEGRLRIVLDGAERKTRFLRADDDRGGPRREPWQ
jgi:hypothetical protein